VQDAKLDEFNDILDELIGSFFPSDGFDGIDQIGIEHLFVGFLIEEQQDHHVDVLEVKLDGLALEGAGKETGTVLELKHEVTVIELFAEFGYAVTKEEW
jgi:hypothetical protein